MAPMPGTRVLTQCIGRFIDNTWRVKTFKHQHRMPLFLYRAQNFMGVTAAHDVSLVDVNETLAH